MKIQRPLGNKQLALTVIELMVSVTLVSFIILALYQMFARTQQQMRRAINQVDTLESGRAVMKQIQRDLGFAVIPDEGVTNALTFYWSTNWSMHTNVSGLTMVSSVNPAISNQNQWDRFFFTTFDLSADQRFWGGIGYHVGSPENPWLVPTNGFGTLYRYSTNYYKYSPAFANIFGAPNSTNFMARLIDNVVHFKVNPWPTNTANPNFTDGVNFQVLAFLGNDIPSMVEVELGYLDSDTAEQALAFESSTVAQRYISERPERVTFFRFLVPIQVASQ